MIDRQTDLKCFDETSKQAEERRRRQSSRVLTVILDNVSIQLLTMHARRR